MPIRIQRKRVKGWRMPEGAKYVGRPSYWGNPWEFDSVAFVFGPPPDNDWWNFESVEQARAFTVERYTEWLDSPGDTGQPRWVEARIELGGKDLACWCSLDGPCHADVLLAVANPVHAETPT